MELEVFDLTLNNKGLVDVYTELEVEINYDSGNNLRLIVDASKENVELLKEDMILTKSNDLERGYIIKHVEFLDDNSSRLLIDAPSVNVILNDRLILGQQLHEGNIEDVMKAFVKANAVNPVNPKRFIPNLIIGENTGIDIEVSETAIDEPLDEYLYELAKKHDISWDVLLNHENKKYVFTTWQGLDRTTEQDGIEKVPKKVEGTFDDVRLDEVDLWKNRNLAKVNEAQIVNHTLSPSNQGEFVDSRTFKINANPNNGIGALFGFSEVKHQQEYTLNSDLSKGISTIIGVAVYDANKKLLEEPGLLSGNFNWVSTYRRYQLHSDGVLHPPYRFKISDERVKYVRASVGIYRGAFITHDVFFSFTKLEIGTTATPWQPAPEDGIPWYHPTKTINLTPIKLTELGYYTGSIFTWESYVPDKTSAIVECSVDGNTWSTLVNGGTLPLSEDEQLMGRALFIRIQLTSSDRTVTPSIKNFSYEITGYTTTENASVVFSKELDNIITQEYITDNLHHKTTAIVAGEGEDVDRVRLTVNDELSGYDRKEIFVDARDLQRSYKDENDLDVNLSPTEYENVLKERGKNTLSEYKPIRTFESEIDMYSQFVYGADYFCGDKVTIENEDIGIVMHTRVMSAVELYTKDSDDLKLDFGSSIPTLIDSIKRMVK